MNEQTRAVVARALERRYVCGMRRAPHLPQVFTDHDEILHFPEIADRDDKFNVRPLVVHVVHFDWREDMEMGKLEAYVCRECGYTEETYTHDVKKLPIEKIPGAKILKGTRA